MQFSSMSIAAPNCCHTEVRQVSSTLVPPLSDVGHAAPAVRALELRSAHQARLHEQPRLPRILGADREDHALERPLAPEPVAQALEQVAVEVARDLRGAHPE